MPRLGTLGSMRRSRPDLFVEVKGLQTSLRATNGLYRVDLKTGQVDDLGSVGHLGGEGEGIDATKLPSGRIHTLTVDAAGAPVWLGHFAVAG